VWRVVLALSCACGRVAFDPLAHDAAPNNTIDAPNLSLEAGTCPPGYIFGGLTCYRMAPMADWVSAEKACEADAVGAHLVVIGDLGELGAVSGLLPLTGAAWIGTSKRTTANYRTVIDTVPFLMLGTQTEPSEDCLSLALDTKMYLHSCPDRNPSICEYDGIAAVPSAY
jgi:lectin-like protein